MKKALYIILLLAELVGGFILLTLVSMGAMGLAFLLTVTAIWAVVTALVLVKLKKAEADSKRKLKVFLALAMLIPAVGAAAGLGWFIWQWYAAGLL